MNALVHDLSLPPVCSEEDAARAEHYALLSRLFAAPPDAGFLQRLGSLAATRGSADNALGLAWRELGAAASAVDAAAAEEEYTRLFLTIGRPEVMLFGSFYLAGFLMEEPLVELRNDLAELGLARWPGVGESEDHIAALCDVMRLLVLSASDPAGLMRQRAFFGRHLAPWFEALCQALEAAPEASFYPHVVPLLRAFFEVERLAFDMV